MSTNPRVALRRAAVVTLMLVLQANLLPSSVAAADVPTTITLTASTSVSYRDEYIVLRATVSPNPGGGQVVFYDTTSGNCLCGSTVSEATGDADLEVRIHDLGTRQLQAVFIGFGEFAASESDLLAHERRLRESSVALEIGPIDDVGEVALTTTVVPHNVGGTVSITATSGEAVISDAVVDAADGVQTFVLGAPLRGSGPYVASYSGTEFYEASASDPVAWADDRTPTTTSLEVTPAVGAPYDTWTLDVKVDPAEWGGPMDGVARLYSVGQLAPFATVPVSGNGVARYSGQIIVPGTATFYTVFSGDEDYVTSTSAEVTVVAERIPVSTTLQLSASEMRAGDSVVATVTLDPAPTVFPPDPVVGLTLRSEAGDFHFEAIAIDPTTGTGQATITSDELVPGVWTAIATFAEAPPVSSRYEPSESEPVTLRYEQPLRCIRFIASQFNPPGSDARNLNSEWVQIQSVCQIRRLIGGWRIHDYQRSHVYRIPDGFRIRPGVTVTLHTGSGDNTRRHLYWGKDVPVWNNAAPEWAYLKRLDRALVGRWTEF